MSANDWWTEFFSEVWPRIQAAGYPGERTSAECDLIADLLRLEPGAAVLDIPCGIGRHSVELARRGHRVTGTDLKPDFIEQARTAAREAGVAASFVVSDMREFDSAERFDAAFCYFGSFGYFRGDGDARFLRAVARALRPGGRFLIDTHLMETILPVFRQRDRSWADAPTNSCRLLEERTWDVETGRMEVTWTVHDDEASRSSHTSIRIYSFPELRALLEAAGFEGAEAHDGRTGDALRLGSERAAVVARRPAS